MATGNALDELERRIEQLPIDEQLWLAERLLHRVRLQGQGVRPDLAQGLAAMAADPEIQRELREIQDEFSATESDGLENC
jgi:hypothetical protein